ncbi:MAG TPA: DEAD/DEAH box helicase [Gemmataceae bacterium]|nr:DEAD/DEAH box helicase [Gemmataceae bacterium]
MTTALMVEPQNGFHTLGLSPSILSALQRAEYFEPTPIQAALIPEALSGRDVIGQAQTGTGKTAAFLLPFLDRWREKNEPGPLALVLAPTRELVVQVSMEARKLAPSRHFRTVAIYGGQRFRQQLTELKSGCHIAIGTPGRVLDHLGRGTLMLDRVRYVVLDEADRMLDIGFRPDIERILRRCPKQRQTFLLSATLPAPVLRLAQRYMIKPIHINLSPEQLTVESIRQTFMTVDEEHKFDLLLKVLDREKPRQCIIFCERKRWADELYRHLRRVRKGVAAMHGDLEQPERERIMQAFREAKIVCLVATDVVGRGIDVTNISHIINYDLPEDPENYVHRIGRTGRMGADGVAIAFVTREQGLQLTAIETLINKQLEEDRIEGFQAFTPRSDSPEPEAEAPRPVVPVFGRRTRRYSQRP